MIAAPGVERCFREVTREDTRVLVLGSLPGAESLRLGRYYAHPRNQFWRLIGAVIERELGDLAYEQRLQALLDAGIGLGDTVAAATRIGSLDANIRMHKATDLSGLLATLPRLRAIAFNGAKAASIGRRQLAGTRNLDLVDLPSSSPAFAAMSFDKKRDAWCRLRLHLAPQQV